MTPAQRRNTDKRVREGLPAELGVVPKLDGVAAYYARLWTDLRSHTPSEHPLSLNDLISFVGRDGAFHVLPLLQAMDGARFEFIGRKREADMKRQEARTKAARSRGRRR
ncbi:MAG TPA: hypothetical protein VFD92_04635 [Candidatus Binatia bacterium]|nr:hypothetical protein [Candidatus Binatia bacterium]